MEYLQISCPERDIVVDYAHTGPPITAEDRVDLAAFMAHHAADLYVRECVISVMLMTVGPVCSIMIKVIDASRGSSKVAAALVFGPVPPGAGIEFHHAPLYMALRSANEMRLRQESRTDLEPQHIDWGSFEQNVKQYRKGQPG